MRAFFCDSAIPDKRSMQDTRGYSLRKTHSQEGDTQNGKQKSLTPDH